MQLIRYQYKSNNAKTQRIKGAQNNITFYKNPLHCVSKWENGIFLVYIYCFQHFWFAPKFMLHKKDDDKHNVQISFWPFKMAWLSIDVVRSGGQWFLLLLKWWAAAFQHIVIRLYETYSYSSAWLAVPPTNFHRFPLWNVQHVQENFAFMFHISNPCSF